ncbi:MAG: radical SAM protein [Candidatus Omnitrophica bacterium]|nr:radical SAM protein [Candidatus Omnitrophota bacterium]
MGSIDLFLTNRCNKQCACCFVKEKSRGSSLTREDFDKIIPHLKRAKVERVALIGGEPTIYPELGYVTQGLRRNNIKYDIFSNGLFDVRSLEGIALEGVQVSVHLPYDAKTEKKAVNNLRYLHKRKAKAILRDVINEGYNFSKAIRFIEQNRKYISGVRVKIAQPNLERNNEYLRDIAQVKTGLLTFLRIVCKMGMDVSNCCFLPYCEFSTDELDFLKSVNYLSRCRRVFYIDTDLTLKICPYHNETFGTLEDLGAVLAGKHLIKVPVYEKCAACHHYISNECIPCFSYSNSKDDLVRFRKVIGCEKSATDKGE